MLSKSRRRVFAMVLSFVLVLTSFTFAPSAKNVVSAADTGLTLKVEAGNGWNDGTATYQQFNCTLTNNSTGAVSDWELAFHFDSTASFNQGWCGTYSLGDDGTLSVTSTDGNATIQKGASTTFGFIAKNIGTWSDEKAEVVSYKVDGKEAGSSEPVESEAVVSEVPATSETVVTTETAASEETPETSEAVVSEEPAVSEPVESVEPTTSADVTTQKDWLSCEGNKIVDCNGKQVWLTGLNWFGYNTGTNCFDGIWSADLNTALEAIADRGFNIIRIPFSSELLLAWENGEYPEPCYNDYVNTYLAGMNSLEIFDYVVNKCDQLGIKIMIDIHCATNAAAHYAPLWYAGDVDTAAYLESLNWVSNRYKNNDTVVAYDLENEPHGKASETQKAIWNDSEDINNWKHVAEVAGKTVLNNNPNALVLVEGVEVYPMDTENNSDYHSTNNKEYYGTWWGGNLRGVADYPVDLGEYQSQLVYSPHDYGPLVSAQSWFEKDFTYDTLMDDVWYDNWFYIYDQDIAPLLIGEWGGFMDGGTNEEWMNYLSQLIQTYHLNHTFWCFNANSGDTGGLVGYDFTTWDEEKYALVKDCLWQVDGQFVGLSQTTKLGNNGTCVGDIDLYNVTE